MAKIVFISYASEDVAIGTRICDYLEQNGLSCWIAPRDVTPGSDYSSEIVDGIESSRVFVLVLSQNANDSVFVKREVERAVSKGKPIFSIRVNEVVPSKSLELFISAEQWIDAWEPPLERHLDRLVETVRSEVEHNHPGAPRAAIHPPTATKGQKKRRYSRALAAAVIAAVVVGVALFTYQSYRTQRPPTLPQTTGQLQPPLVASQGDTSGSSNTKSSTSAEPATPGSLPSARPATAPVPLKSGSDLPPGPCPARLSINPNLPTPFTCSCTAEAAGSGTVWGTDIYTDDSALCRAAVHAGAITAAGGTVSVLRTEGRPLYVGTTRNGVESNDYGANRASIRFEGTALPPAGPGPCPARLSVNPNLQTPFTCSCTAEAAGSGTVWGTDIYTDDSALCRAAVHAGAITAAGGTVSVLRTEGRALYVGTTRNGVESNDYGANRASIRFK
jgi:hypothetical protein